MKTIADSFKELTGEDFPNLTGDKPVKRKKMVVINDCDCCIWNDREGYCGNLDKRLNEDDSFLSDCPLEDYNG